MVGLVFPPVSHTKWLCTCHHAQIPLHGRFAISPLEVKEHLAIYFHNLHHKAHTSPVVPGIFTTGDSDLLGSPIPPPQSFCTTWLSRLNTGSSTSLFSVLHKPLSCSCWKQHHHIIWSKGISIPSGHRQILPFNATLVLPSLLGAGLRCEKDGNRIYLHKPLESFEGGAIFSHYQCAPS